MDSLSPQLTNAHVVTSVVRCRSGEFPSVYNLVLNV